MQEPAGHRDVGFHIPLLQVMPVTLLDDLDGDLEVFGDLCYCQAVSGEASDLKAEFGGGMGDLLCLSDPEGSS